MIANVSHTAEERGRAADAVVVVDYGVGNRGSITNMLRRLGVDAVVSSEHEDIRKASRIILPGVGSFDRGMRNLRSRGLVEVLEEVVLGDRVPILGICLGMQLLALGSEEGSLPGLRWIAADVVKFDFKDQPQPLPVPHMGWNTVRMTRHTSLLDARSELWFYFLHSYHVQCHHQTDVLGVSTYGQEFVCAVQKANIFGVQFHPEKSLRYGLSVLRGFISAGPDA